VLYKTENKVICVKRFCVLFELKEKMQFNGRLTENICDWIN